MTSLVEATKQEQVPSDYHEEIEKFFIEKHLKLSVLPSDLKNETAVDYFTIEIGSAKQYRDYLQQEISFWKENDPQNKFSSFSHISYLTSALSNFDSAVGYANSNAQNSSTNMRNSLNSCVSDILSHGSLYSKLQFTEFLLTLKDKNSDYLSGVRLYFQKTRSTNLPNKIDTLDGYYAAMEYARILEGYKKSAEESLTNFKNNIELASTNYSSLNEAYTTAFREQQKRIQEIQDQTNSHFRDFERNNVAYFETANQRVSELEYLYGEKLKLSEPANYWETIDAEYRKKGTKWLIISCILACFIIGGLICMIVFLPNLFSKGTELLESIKNSVIITVLTSIAIYMFRLCIKMSTTSYHLSRDAKERRNLSYFYLSLIQQGAVSDKERALILNALFSRSDTGLLKGDSSPSMPSNISDLINIIGKTNDIK